MTRVLSISETVTVILTEEGADTVNKNLDKKRYTAGETFSAPLWEIMAMFGPHFGAGKQAPFVNGTITTNR